MDFDFNDEQREIKSTAREFFAARFKPEKVRELLTTVPETPGVYFMKDARGRVLYIGKAKNLRARLSNYFGGDLHPFLSRANTSQR